ncbi:N-acetylmuramoyl-L-alanine amidase [Alteribacillus persepolensis]|uniref:N-acetylmuramoyl-L-alanine amidase n=1 Tax=Alteribacillus persepolensis TaxID=568899 RepID=A0A1G8IKR2_9BACI|nr:N-acetylmuramoyl-L-alanine amidase [Alteribacillus persepolensis]SDI19569.1 N-acetylmuramoyl-L-alanine amidase [Alteribacillus persepolensis]
MKTIVFDAGHGGHDNGANGFGLYEKDLCEDRVKRMKIILENEYENVKIILTRSDDTFLELRERAQIANRAGADVFISDHKNAFNGKARGFESFIWNGGVGAATRSLQNIVHRSVYNKIKKYDIPDRGTKQANFSVLRNTKMSAILLEEAFIDNRADNNLLQKKEFSEAYCRGVVEGLAEFLGLKKKADQQNMKSVYKEDDWMSEKLDKATKEVWQPVIERWTDEEKQHNPIGKVWLERIKNDELECKDIIRLLGHERLRGLK